ncbi:AAA family ATPase [Stenotrophomonas cyclobalanopsidis]|uniref:AAA family ATPase n=1 Tax=Stenotrophomonas cyclobalanopsidis TaxID=2771362 RepID=UPI002FDA7C63
MKLEFLSLSYCGGFEQLDIAFEPDVTLIAGVNGVGKSTLLRALGVVLSRTQQRIGVTRNRPLSLKPDDIYTGSEVAYLAASMNFDERKVRAEFSQRSNSRSTKKFDLFGSIPERSSNECLAVYFSPKRQLPGQPRSLPEAKPFDPSIAYGRALHDREVELREFMHWFRTQEKLGADGEPRRLKVLDLLRAVISELVPEFSNLRIQEQPRLGFVVDKRGQPFFLHQLSDGERGLLALVFDLTRRLAIANPDTDSPIAEGVALVMIDEIELHLHPKWQRDVIKRLPSIFKSCQFVITTHSPQVIGEVEARCVRLLTWRDGKVVVDTPAMAYGTDSNWILSVLMGAEEISQEVEAKLENVSRLISGRDLDNARSQISSLREDVGNTEAIQRLASMIERIGRLGR